MTVGRCKIVSISRYVVSRCYCFRIIRMTALPDIRVRCINVCYSSWSGNWVLCTCENPPGPGNHSPPVLRVTSLIICLEKFVLLDNDGYLTTEEISSICGTQKLITVAAKIPRRLSSSVLQFILHCQGWKLYSSFSVYVLVPCFFFREVSHLKFNICFLFTCCRLCYIKFGQLSLWAEQSYMSRIIQIMVCYDLEKDDNFIFKNNQDRRGNILLLKAFVMCKMEPPSCICCKIDILWVVPLFTKWVMWLHPMSRGMMMVVVMMSHLSSLFICVLPDQPNGQLRRQHRHKEKAARTQVKNNSKAEKGNGENTLN